MIIYNVTVNIDNDIAEDWLKWMIDIHIPEVLKTGLFLDNHIYRLLADENSGGTSYAIQYLCENLDNYEQYKNKFAATLQAEHTARYQGKFVAFRTLLEVVK